jgi:hypothetical protein
MYNVYRPSIRNEFVQELYESPKRRKELDENPRGFVEIDLDNGKTIEII